MLDRFAISLQKLCSRSLTRPALVVAATLSSALLTPSKALAATPVDLQLFLSWDISGSVNASEYELQRTGYVNAFQSTQVRNAIKSKPLGVAVAVSQWATTDSQLELPWMLLKTDSDIDNFTANMATLARNTSEGTLTCVSCGINFANSQFNTVYSSSFKTLDVSGDDSSDNVFGNGAVATARNNAETAGILINGLPIGGSLVNDFYRDYVITQGLSDPDLAGSLYPANDFSDVSLATQTKLTAEINGVDGAEVPGPLPVLGALSGGVLSRRLRRRIQRSRTC